MIRVASRRMLTDGLADSHFRSVLPAVGDNATGAGIPSRYPFARTADDVPLGQAWKPSAERAASILDDLLTNVYRSFDLRDENAICDRVATSVTGDQLTKVYAENRKSLELEDRGGVRAKVDEVKWSTEFRRDDLYTKTPSDPRVGRRQIPSRTV